MQEITLFDIEKTFKERSWWAIVFNLPTAKYITHYIVNKTEITPNQVTTISFLFAIFSGVAFYFQNYFEGAILYQISYTLDIVDGSIARSKNLSSKIGAFYDVFTDWLKAPILFIILFLVMNNLYSLIVLYFLLFLSCLINKYNDMLFFQGAKSITVINNNGRTNPVGIYGYIQKMKNKNIQPFPSSVEVEGVLLFFYPLTQSIIFIYIAFFILIFNIFIKLYAILKKLK